MPQQYVVPQFIDVEDKILGPITTRQFIILLVTIGAVFIIYRLDALYHLHLVLFIFLGLPLLGAGLTLSFVRINGQPFHFFLLNMIQTKRHPVLRVWNKELSDAEIRNIINRPPPPPPAVKVRKEALATNKLAELALIVNTGGVYRSE